MTPDRIPYVRTIVLPPRRLTDREIEMLRAMRNGTRQYSQDELRPVTPGAWFVAKLTLALRDSAAETCWSHPPGVRLELDFTVTSA